MSFSAEWLALREPVDHRSVNRELAGRVADWFGEPDHISIMDLGCGAGSNLRGTWQLFGDSQHWTLVDYDPVLLAQPARVWLHGPMRPARLARSCCWSRMASA
jgi:hypothetical protein